jgi:DNA-binding LytR/AlgR family response regulator
MNTALKIALCEDIDEDAELLRGFIENCAAKEGASADISRFGTGEAFLASTPAGKYHLVFMDVYMSGITGVQTALALRESDERCGIVFTTTSEDHALDGYRVNAMQYLVKPVKQEEAEKALRQILSRLERSRKEICTVMVNRQRRDIPLHDILYAEARDHCCLIHTASEIIETSRALDEIEKSLLPPLFFRSHRAYIVNFEYVREIGRDFIMKNGDIAFIRKGGVKICAEAYKAWLMDLAWKDEF